MGRGRSAPAADAPETEALRICLDLNVYVSDLLATRRGRRGTAVQACVAAVRRGSSDLGDLRLVVSWGMLTRLRDVLEGKLALPRGEVERYLGVVARASGVGTPGAPLVVLGGTGAMPVRDAEDAHVVDVAIAGRADVIVTGNFADFVSYRTEVVRPDRVAVIAHAAGRLVVAHPAEFAGWVRGGEVPKGDLASGAQQSAS
ncbi:PIN domain-containing protein [Gemmatimonadetes bacterium T265]|nr:PIN domain-containing protein [Gemmatimonadetes bacterium T265]